MIYFISEKENDLFIFYVRNMYIHKTAGIYIYAYTYIRYNRKCIYKRFQQRKAVKNLGFGVSAIILMVLLALPFGISNVIDQYTTTMASYPYLTVNAFNLWGALGKNWEGLSSFTTVIGYVFLIAIVAYSVYVFFKSKNNAKYYFVGALLAFMTYMLSTKMHDRYAFPAMGLLLLAFVSVTDFKNFIMYALVTLSQFFNTAWVLFVYEKSPNDYFRSAPVLIAVFNKCCTSDIYSLLDAKTLCRQRT